MLKIGGQRIPTKILVLVISEALLIIFGLAFATWLRFLSSHWEYAGGHTISRFLVVVLILWLVQRLPVEARIKQIIQIVVIIVGIIALLKYLAVF